MNQLCASAASLSISNYLLAFCFHSIHTQILKKKLTNVVVKLLQVTENGKQERHLVVTVGKFSVIWNFQQVKNVSHECYRDQEGLKSCYCYKIVLKDDSIVD